MALTFEGQGTTYTVAGLTLKPKKITVPGWSKEEIDVTNLSNSDVKTFFIAQLKTTGDIVLNLEFDASVYAAIPETNLEWKLTFSGTTENIKFWATVKEVGNVDEETDNQPTFDLTVKVTNLNAAGVETAPVYAAA
jgi:hypothetical protein